MLPEGFLCAVSGDLHQDTCWDTLQKEVGGKATPRSMAGQLLPLVEGLVFAFTTFGAHIYNGIVEVGQGTQFFESGIEFLVAQLRGGIAVLGQDLVWYRQQGDGYRGVRLLCMEGQKGLPLFFIDMLRTYRDKVREAQPCISPYEEQVAHLSQFGVLAQVQVVDSFQFLDGEGYLDHSLFLLAKVEEVLALVVFPAFGFQHELFEHRYPFGDVVGREVALKYKQIV